LLLQIKLLQPAQRQRQQLHKIEQTFVVAVVVVFARVAVELVFAAAIFVLQEALWIALQEPQSFAEQESRSFSVQELLALSLNV